MLRAVFFLNYFLTIYLGVVKYINVITFHVLSFNSIIISRSFCFMLLGNFEFRESYIVIFYNTVY